MPVFGGISALPVVIGHRGLRRPGIAENTPTAFAAAFEEGAEWVELDARRSADGVPVVYHDGWTADRTPIVSRTAAELKSAGIFALADVLDALPAGLGVNIEVKNLPGEPDYDPDDAIAEMVAGVMADRQPRPVLLSSFNPLTVAALVRSRPDLPAGLIHYEGIAVADAIPLALEFGAVALASRIGAAGLDEPGIGAAHAAGLEVMVWTVNDLAEATRLAAAGVEALCTDDPAALIAGLAATRPG